MGNKTYQITGKIKQNGKIIIREFETTDLKVFMTKLSQAAEAVTRNQMFDLQIDIIDPGSKQDKYENYSGGKKVKKENK